MCKKFYLILILQKQLYIPSNPLLASFSGYVAETQCCQGFCEIKTTGRSLSKKNDFAEILARQGFGDFLKKIKLREKNFVAIEKHLNLSSLQKRLNLIL